MKNEICNGSRHTYNPSKYRRDHKREHGKYYRRPRELSEVNHHSKPWRHQIQFKGFNHSDSRPWDNRLGTPRTQRDDERDHLGHNRKREYHERDDDFQSLRRPREHRDDRWEYPRPPRDHERDHVGHKRKSTSHLEHVDYDGKRRCHEKGNGSDSLKQPLGKLSPSKLNAIPTPTAKGRKPEPGFIPTPTTPNSPNEKKVTISGGEDEFKENLKKAFNETNYISHANRVVAVSFYVEKIVDKNLESDAAAVAQVVRSPEKRKEYQLVICLGKSSNGDWRLNPTKKDAFIKEVHKAVSIKDENGNDIYISDVKLKLLNRMANTFTYEYIRQMALDYAKNNSVDIRQLSKIKDEVTFKFNTVLKSLKTSHRIDAERYILDFIHLVNGTYSTDVRLPFPRNFREIEDLVTSTAQRICESASVPITNSEKVNKTADFLWIFAHNPLCAEKNIWYTEQKFNDSAVTQQLRTETGQLMVAFQPSIDKDSWGPKPACLSCQALGKMRETYIAKVDPTITSPLKNTATVDPRYSGSKPSVREPHTFRTGANQPLF